jgi:hypothetical protein
METPASESQGTPVSAPIQHLTKIAETICHFDKGVGTLPPEVRAALVTSFGTMVLEQAVSQTLIYELTRPS